MIAKKGGYDQMLEVLRTGGVLSFLADQDAGERGMFVDFFGRPASTHKAIAIMAIEHKAPVVVGYARRIGPGFRYEVGCTDLIEPDEWTGTADDAQTPHPALHRGPRSDHPPRPRPVPLAPSPLEAPAQAQEGQGEPRPGTHRRAGLIESQRDRNSRFAPSGPIRTVYDDPSGVDRNLDELAPGRVAVGDQGGVGVVGGRGRQRSCGAGRPPRIEGTSRSRRTVAGEPPLRGPLSMIATVGAIVRSRVGWFEMSIPWWVTWNRSIGPILSVGQTSFFSMFQVRSPQSRKSNRPGRTGGPGSGRCPTGRPPGRRGRRRAGWRAPRGADRLAARGQDDGLDPALERQAVAGLERRPLARGGLPVGDAQRVVRARAVGEARRSPSAAWGRAALDPSNGRSGPVWPAPRRRRSGRCASGS